MAPILRVHSRFASLLVLASLIGVHGAALGGGFAGYSPPTRWHLGAMPSDVQIADVDGDGHLDLIATAKAANTFGLQLGTGQGSFKPGTTANTIASPQALVVTDFNGDSFPDVAIVSDVQTSLAVHMNRGDGTFTPAALMNIGIPGDVLVHGDFDGDGTTDLFIAHRDERKLTLVVGEGQGAFVVARSFDMPHYPWSIRAVHANGDDATDLGIGLLSGGQINAIRLMLSDGNGGFLAPVDTSINRQPVDLDFGFFDDDAHLDCATIDLHAGVATTLFGVGDGTFVEPSFHPFNGQPEEMKVIDIDNDGFDDVVAAHSYFQRVTTLVSKGDRSFQIPLWHALPTRGNDMAIGDFDENGFTDLVVTHAAMASMSASVLLNETIPGRAADLIDVRTVVGQIIFGPVEDIRRPDSVTLRARAEVPTTFIAPPSVDLRVTAQSFVSNPQSLNVTVKSGVNIPAIMEQVRLFNFDTGQFDVIGRYRSGPANQLHTLQDVVAPPYIGPDGMMELSIRTGVQPAFAQRSLETFVDWIEIAVE